jgi:hypothetical protein
LLYKRLLASTPALKLVHDKARSPAGTAGNISWTVPSSKGFLTLERRSVSVLLYKDSVRTAL